MAILTDMGRIKELREIEVKERETVGWSDVYRSAGERLARKQMPEIGEENEVRKNKTAIGGPSEDIWREWEKNGE